MKLAHRCGEPHPELLLGRLDPRQFAETREYVERAGDPDLREDVRAGMIALVVAKSGGSKSARLADFVLADPFAPAEPEATAADAQAAIEQAFVRMEAQRVALARRAEREARRRRENPPPPPRALKRKAGRNG